MNNLHLCIIKVNYVYSKSTRFVKLLITTRKVVSSNLCVELKQFWFRLKLECTAIAVKLQENLITFLVLFFFMQKAQ